MAGTITPQEFSDQIVGQVKSVVMQILNETADEFDAREMTDDQKRIYNDFTGAFGQKVLAIKIIVEAH